MFDHIESRALGTPGGLGLRKMMLFPSLLKKRQLMPLGGSMLTWIHTVIVRHCMNDPIPWLERNNILYFVSAGFIGGKRSRDIGTRLLTFPLN